MTALTRSRIADAPAPCTDEEREARQDLAALYRAIDILGLTDHIYNHASLRVPGAEPHFLVNSFGMLYDEVTASSLFKVDLQGNVVSDPENGYRYAPAAFVIHGAVHAARHDLGCVIHTHSRAVSAVAAMKCGLLPMSQHACVLAGKVSYHDFEGIAHDTEEQKRLVEDLGDTKVMILRNHGLLACGTTLAEAFVNLITIERACQIQVDALSCGQDYVLASDEAVARTVAVVREYEAHMGQMEWAAMRRRVDKVDPGYRL